MLPHACRVLRTQRETEDTWTLDLKPPANGSSSFEAGQFNMIYAFGVGEVPVSICGDPTREGPLEHTVRSVGAVTAAICASRPGDSLAVRGPFGSSWPLDAAEGRDLVVVAGGIGLAPLRPALLHALARRERHARLVLLYGSRSPEQLLYTEELEAWRREDVEVGVTVDSATREWRGDVGVVTRLIDEAELDPGCTTSFLCGPEVMMRFAIQALRERAVAPDDIYLSLERNMKCAITHCGRCVFGPTYVCREGPVVRCSDIEPWLAIREL
jgi:NAD(P)H-flavin reductase